MNTRKSLSVTLVIASFQVCFQSDDELSRLCAQLANNIQFNGLGLNRRPVDKKCRDESSLDIAVDRCLKGGERVVVLAQRVSKFAVAELLIGYMVIASQSGNRWFWMCPPVDTFDPSNIK